MRPPSVASRVRRQLVAAVGPGRQAFSDALEIFARQRFIARLPQEKPRPRFWLKGATLLPAWLPDARPTANLDLHDSSARGDGLLDALRAVCAAPPPQDDGLTFRADSLVHTVGRSTSGLAFDTVTLQACLEPHACTLTLHVTRADAERPGPEKIDLPNPIEPWPAVPVWAIVRELFFAEKLHAMVDVDDTAIRMVDIFDAYTLCETQTLDGGKLCAALRATFEKRVGQLPQAAPRIATHAFADGAAAKSAWKAFARHAALPRRGVSLVGMAQTLEYFLDAPIATMARNHGFTKIWEPGGPWR